MRASLKVVLLAVAAALVAVVPIASSLSTTTSIANAAPVVASASLSGIVGGALSPVAGGTTTSTVSIVVTDVNGFQDVTGVTVSVRRPDGAVHSASAAATFASGSLTSSTWTFPITLQFHSMPALSTSTYKVDVVATDSKGATGTGLAVATFNYNELAALATGASVDFGTLEPGASSSATSLSVTNRGNVRLDTQLSGTALANATTGASIPAGSIRWSTASDMTGSAALSGAPATAGGFDLASGASSSGNLWWQLAAPDGESQWIPEGVYTGTLTVTAVKG